MGRFAIRGLTAIAAAFVSMIGAARADRIEADFIQGGASFDAGPPAMTDVGAPFTARCRVLADDGQHRAAKTSQYGLEVVLLSQPAGGFNSLDTDDTDNQLRGEATIGGVYRFGCHARVLDDPSTAPALVAEINALPVVEAEITASLDDDSEPFITLSAPTGHQIQTAAAKIRVAGTIAEPESGLASVVVRNLGAETPATVTERSDAPGTFDFIADTPYTPGLSILQVVATNNAGLKGQRTIAPFIGQVYEPLRPVRGATPPFTEDRQVKMQLAGNLLVDNQPPVDSLQEISAIIPQILAQKAGFSGFTEIDVDKDIDYGGAWEALEVIQDPELEGKVRFGTPSFSIKLEPTRIGGFPPSTAPSGERFVIELTIPVEADLKIDITLASDEKMTIRGSLAVLVPFDFDAENALMAKLFPNDIRIVNHLQISNSYKSELNEGMRQATADAVRDQVEELFELKLPNCRTAGSGGNAQVVCDPSPPLVILGKDGNGRPNQLGFLINDGEKRFVSGAYIASPVAGERIALCASTTIDRLDLEASRLRFDVKPVLRMNREKTPVFRVSDVAISRDAIAGRAARAPSAAGPATGVTPPTRPDRAEVARPPAPAAPEPGPDCSGSFSTGGFQGGPTRRPFPPGPPGLLLDMGVNAGQPVTGPGTPPLDAIFPGAGRDVIGAVHVNTFNRMLTQAWGAGLFKFDLDLGDLLTQLGEDAAIENQALADLIATILTDASVRIDVKAPPRLTYYSASDNLHLELSGVQIILDFTARYDSRLVFETAIRTPVRLKASGNSLTVSIEDPDRCWSPAGGLDLDLDRAAMAIDRAPASPRETEPSAARPSRAAPLTRRADPPAATPPAARVTRPDVAIPGELVADPSPGGAQNRCLSQFSFALVEWRGFDADMPVPSDISNPAAHRALVNALMGTIGNPNWSAVEKRYADMLTPMFDALYGDILSASFAPINLPPLEADDVPLNADIAPLVIQGMTIPDAARGGRASKGWVAFGADLNGVQ